jgi:hypothetical protein
MVRLLLAQGHDVTCFNVAEPAITWAEYHRTAMQVLGREVALVSVSLEELRTHHMPRGEICQEIFAHHTSPSGAKLRRAVPTFRPAVSLRHGMHQVFAAMERARRIPPADGDGWKDRLIAVYSQQPHPETGNALPPVRRRAR